MTNETIRDETLDAVTAVVRSVLPMDGDAMWDATASAAARELNASGLLARAPGDETADMLAMLVDYARSRGVRIPEGFAPVRWEDYHGTISLSQDAPWNDLHDPWSATVDISYVHPIPLAQFALTWKPGRA